ncbi:GNAT family N-acetyltransferase [Pasteurella multocida]
MLTGEKVALRAIELKDSELLQHLMNDPLITGKTIGWTFPVSLHAQENFIKSLSNSNKDYRFIVVDKQTRAAIGLTGLWNIHWQNRSAESAIKLSPHESQKGYGTETIMLMMAWAFYTVGLRRLYAEILTENAPSLAVYLKKCYWRIEGTQREAIFKAGEWRDVHNIAILKEEFDQLPEAQKYIHFVCPNNKTPTR